jgi:four helix bundle protein
MAPVSRTSPARSPELLQERLIAFCVEVWQRTENMHRGVTMARLRDQVMRSATSVAANYAEARAAESRRDFIHKMQVCLKEIRETGVWLEIVGRLDDPERVCALARECSELTAIFVTSIKTARGPRPRR